jgi:hypothetical protein
LSLKSKSLLLTDALYETKPYIDEATTYFSAHLLKRAIENASMFLSSQQFAEKIEGPEVSKSLREQIEQTYEVTADHIREQIHRVQHQMGVLAK